MAAYPRSQTVVIFVACLLVVGGVYFYVHTQNPGSVEGPGPRESVQASVTPSTTPLANGDDSWKTQFIDTIGKIDPKRPAPIQQAAKSEAPLTETDRLGRNFMVKFAELERAGLVDDQSTVGNIAATISTESLSRLPVAKIFGTKDIREDSNDAGSLRAYATTVMSALRSYMPRQNAADVADRALTDGNASELSQIDVIISSYSNMLAALQSTPVPSRLASYHLGLLNAASLALRNARSFRHVDSDPLPGLAAVTSELTAMQDMMAALNGIQTYLDSAGIKLGT